MFRYASTIGDLGTLGVAILVEDFNKNLVSLDQLSSSSGTRSIKVMYEHGVGFNVITHDNIFYFFRLDNRGLFTCHTHCLSDDRVVAAVAEPSAESSLQFSRAQLHRAKEVRDAERS